MFAIVFGNVADTLHDLDQADREYRIKMRRVEEYMEQRAFPEVFFLDQLTVTTMFCLSTNSSVLRVPRVN